MSILKSVNELAKDYMAASIRWHEHASTCPSWDLRHSCAGTCSVCRELDHEVLMLNFEVKWRKGTECCFECGHEFNDDDRPFFWMGSTMKLALHQKCLVHWYNKGLKADVDRVVAEEKRTT